MVDSFFHLYVSKRNPNMLDFIKGDDERRLKGDVDFDTEAEAKS